MLGGGELVLTVLEIWWETPFLSWRIVVGV